MGKTFHSELRDHQKKLEDAKDRISSCSLQINENEKNKNLKEGLIVASYTYIEKNQNDLCSLGDYENPSKALISILSAYKLLFALQVADEALNETEGTSNDEESNIKAEEDTS